MSESWRPVVGYEGIYQVSDMGRVQSLDRLVIRSNGHPQNIKGRMLRTPLSKVGYPHVHLWNWGKHRTVHVHQLVLEAFVGPRISGMEACHGDGDRTNSRLDNLRWDTSSANRYDSVRHGTHGRLSKNRKAA